MFPRVSVAEYTILWSPTGKTELGYGPSTWVMIATPELSKALGTSQDMLTGWPLLSAYIWKYPPDSFVFLVSACLNDFIYPLVYLKI